MRFLALATVFSAALLTGASLAGAADVGANDDSAKYEPDGGAALFGRMASLGLRQTYLRGLPVKGSRSRGRRFRTPSR